MIVAIDDVQWLDVPSARVLAFVVRRLEDAPSSAADVLLVVAAAARPTEDLVEFLSGRLDPVRRPPAARQATTPA